VAACALSRMLAFAFLDVPGEVFLFWTLGSRKSGLGTRYTALFVALSLAGCADARQTSNVKRQTFGTDDFGDTIRVAGTPTRIASLNPTTTEILFALGTGSRLVGRTTYDHWPDSARFVPDLGAGIGLNVEAILAAKPDLVLLYASQDNRPAAERLRAAGITTAAFKVDRLEQFDALTRLLGRIVGDSARGALVADTVKRTLDRVRSLVQGKPRPTVVMPAWDTPLMVIGGGSFLTQLVEIAGGRNVYDSTPGPSPSVAFEDIVRRNPDYILAGPESEMRLKAKPNWLALRAARSNKFLVLDTNVTMRPAVRLGEGAVSLMRLLHPEIKP
jgi:iron complex transport system substrate-binding protein